MPGCLYRTSLPLLKNYFQSFIGSFSCVMPPNTKIYDHAFFPYKKETLWRRLPRELSEYKMHFFYIFFRGINGENASKEKMYAYFWYKVFCEVVLYLNLSSFCKHWIEFCILLRYMSAWSSFCSCFCVICAYITCLKCSTAHLHQYLMLFAGGLQKNWSRWWYDEKEQPIHGKKWNIVWITAS